MPDYDDFQAALFRANTILRELDTTMEGLWLEYGKNLVKYTSEFRDAIRGFSELRDSAVYGSLDAPTPTIAKPAVVQVKKRAPVRKPKVVKEASELSSVEGVTGEAGLQPA